MAVALARILVGACGGVFLIGGIAVTLLVHAHGASALAPTRETADADMGVSLDVVGDARLVDALRQRGSARIEVGEFADAIADYSKIIENMRREGDRLKIDDLLVLVGDLLGARRGLWLLTAPDRPVGRSRTSTLSTSECLFRHRPVREGMMS